MSPIRKRTLGQTGIEISEVGFGSCFIRAGRNERDQGIRAAQRALELGVNYIDTAPFYGDSQEVLGEALDGRGETYVLGTKCGRWDWETGPHRDVDAFKLQFEKTLQNLRRDSVDILYIHEADWAVFWEDQPIPRSTRLIDPSRSYDFSGAPVVEFLDWAKSQGLTRHFGISGNNAHLLAKVLRESNIGIDVVLVAFQYSLIWRNACEHLLPIAKELGVGVVLGTPFQQGRLSVPKAEWLEARPQWMDSDTHERFIQLYRIQEESGLSLAELGLRFILADQDFDCVLTGASNEGEMEANVGCSRSGPLPAELHRKLEGLGKVFKDPN